jgi:tetratricopeptide (TPR) repeat protein
MNDPEQRILAYPHLSREEQRAVDAYVDDHPEWASLLQDVKSIEDLAAEARLVDEDPPGDPMLATYVAAQRLSPSEVPPVLKEAFGRIAQRLETDDALRARHDEMRRRMRSFEAAVDPVEHLHALGGPDLRADAATADQAPARRASDHRAADPQGRRAGDPGGSGRPVAADRGPERGRKERGQQEDVAHRVGRASTVRWAVAAVVALVAAYGVLFAASRASESPLDRLAAMEIDPDVVDSYRVRTRSAAPPPSPADSMTADALYLKALPLLRTARTSTLGLFPRYDAERLAEAETLLQSVLERTQPGSFLSREARFYLGKVNLAQDDVPQARSYLKAVAEGQGRRAEEAYRILRRLQEVAPPSASGDS